MTCVDSFIRFKMCIQSRNTLASILGENFDEDAFFRGNDQSERKEVEIGESPKKAAYVMQGDFDDDKFFREGLDDTTPTDPAKKATKNTMTAKKAVPKKKKALSKLSSKKEEKTTTSTPVVDSDLIYDDFGDIMDTPPAFSGNTMDQQWLEDEENMSYFDDDIEDTGEKNGGYGKLGSSKLFYTRAELTEAVGGKVQDNSESTPIDNRPIAVESSSSSQSILNTSSNRNDMDLMSLASKVEQLSITMETLKVLNAVLIGIIIGWGINYHIW